MLVRHLGLLAEAVYENSSVIGFHCIRRQGASGATNGFQAAAFTSQGYVVVAFRGTAQAVDATADLALGVGMNSSYFSQGEEFVDSLGAGPNIILCGHSLGGAIAQVVANRKRVPMVSFNAPGVGVLASRNLADASVAMTAVRTAGMLASAVIRPIQAARDAASIFHRVRGINVCLMNDLVSQIGIHYGEVRRIPGTSVNPLTEHGIKTMNSVLRTHAVGSIPVSSL